MTQHTPFNLFTWVLLQSDHIRVRMRTQADKTARFKMAFIQWALAVTAESLMLMCHFSDSSNVNAVWKQAVRVATQYAPPLSSPVGALAPQSRRNVAVLSHAEYVSTLTAAAALRVKARLSKAAWWPYLWPSDLESGVRVTRYVGYLCANFGLPRSLCSRLRRDVRDRQTDERQTSDKSIA